MHIDVGPMTKVSMIVLWYVSIAKLSPINGDWEATWSVKAGILIPRMELRAWANLVMERRRGLWSLQEDAWIKKVRI